ncbi:hypothetical protein [Streptomyces himalayensis]|nr:hypothetical protein [Streptomyces himalayensis]
MAGENAYGSYEDALMLAITDAPVPDDIRGDTDFMAEYDAAVTDLALLREQLRTVGDALARPPEPRPVRRPVAVRPGRVRRGFTLALGVAAVTAAAAMVVGGGWLVTQAGSGASDSAAADKGVVQGENGDAKAGSGSQSQSAVGYVACARLIVEGTVERVEPVTGSRLDLIHLDVERYYKPGSGKEQISFPMDVDVDPRLKQGDHVLIGIPLGQATPDIWSVGKDVADERDWITKALPKARGMECGD